MKSKSTTHRAVLVAIRMMFAMVAIALQPQLSSSGSGCDCSTTESQVPTNTSSTCCGIQKEEAPSTCCSSDREESKQCCCDPTASVCECGACECSEDNDNHSPLPAIPANETTEVVTPVLICAAPIVGYPREREVSRVGYQDTAVEFAALSSQETCVLLSRFTC